MDKKKGRGGRGSRGAIVGRRFGRWTVTAIAENADPYGAGGVRRVVAKCDCGTEREIPVAGLYSGRSTSCGCWHREVVSRLEPDRIGLHAKKRYKQYKRIAGKAGREFSISLDEFRALITADCVYCGASADERPLSERRNGHTSNTSGLNGVDRADNELGYTKENSVSCCPRCNQSKNDLTLEDFLQWIKRVYTFSLVRSNLGT